MNSKQKILASKIDPEAWYSASVIIDNGWFPWIEHRATLKSILDDPEKREVYGAVLREVGNQVRYTIKGQRILAVIKLAEAGQLRT